MSEVPPAPASAAEPPTLWVLFKAFLKIGALGFGGVAALARHVIVVERKMLDERGYAEAFGLASTLPGANTVNLATMLGDRFRGPAGSAAALLGLVGAPLAIIIVVATLYARFNGVSDVRAALAGAAAAAAGLVVGTSLRILKSLDPDVAGVLIAALVCLAAAFLKIPMLLILAVALPLAVGLGIARARRGSR